MSVKISCILPAYKVEQYLERCILSLADQDLPPNAYEIIVTNDGSPDRCADIVKGLQTKIPNLVLVDQHNQGVSMARNNAIAIAQGAYILPIDPDDFVAPNVLQRIWQRVEQDQLDVLYMSFDILSAQGDLLWKTNYDALDGPVYPGTEGYFLSRGFDVRDPDRSWAMLYRKSLLDQYQIQYPKGVPFLEDGLFLAKFFAVAQRVGFDKEAFYLRTIRKGSATNSSLFFKEESLQGFIKAVHDVKAFAAEHSLSNEQQGLINHAVAKFVLLTVSPSIYAKNFKNYFKVVRLLRQLSLDQLNTQGLRFNYGKMAQAFNRSKWLFPFYFVYLNKKYAS